MQNIRIKRRVGSDGLLKFEIPTDLQNKELEILIIIQPTDPAEPNDELVEQLDFIADTYGILADDPIERGPQGEYEVRDEIL